MNSEQIWEKAQCFGADFRRLVRRYMPNDYSESDESSDLMCQMQDKTSCYSPYIWADDAKPTTPTEIVLHVNYAGDRAAGLRSMTDTLRIRCESGEWGGSEGEFQDFIKGAISEWYDGAHVAVAEVHADRHIFRMQNLIERVANLNPDAGEIGEGMLRSLVAEARELAGEAK